MQFQSNPYIVWQIISTIIMLGIVLYIYTRPRKKPETSALALMMFGGALWSLANVIQWMSPDFAWQSRLNILVYLGIILVPTAWFLFAVRYTGIGFVPIVKIGPWLWIFPALTLIVLITNDFHHLFFLSEEIIYINGFGVIVPQYGPLFYIHTAYSYLLLFLGMIILVYSLFSNFKKYGIYAYGLIIGVLTPLLGNIYFLFGPIPETFPDPTPLFFGITGIAFAWTIFGSRMLEVVDFAHESIVKNLSNGIVVLDLDNKILDINPAALRILRSNPQDYVGWPFIKLIENNPSLERIIKTGFEHFNNGKLTHTVEWIDEQSSYELVFTQIKDNFGLVTGSLLEFWDISEKIQAEEKLASTRQAYQLTMDTLQDSYFEADPNGIITYANNAFVSNLGFNDPQEVVGKHFRNFTDRSSVRYIFNKFKLLYETKKPLDVFEYNYRSREGTLYIGETVVSPILRGDEVVGARGTIRDVTSRVKAEREIAEQKDLLDGLLQNAPFAIVINDLNNKITVTNPAFEKIFGYTNEEVLGKNLDNILSTPEILEEMRALSKVALEKEVFHTGKRLKKDGEMVDVDISSVPFYVNEEKYGNLVFYQDISDRLKAESELVKTQITTTEILDSLQDTYFEADLTGVITYSNEAMVRTTEYDSKEEIIGKNFRHFTDRETIMQVFKGFRLLYETGKPVEPIEFHYRTKDGRTFAAEIVASPIIEEGEVIGSRGIVRDISVRIKAEEVLRQAKEAAEYRADELATINRVAEKVGQTLDLQEILDSVCQELTTIFEVKNAGIGLLNKEGDSLEIIAFHTKLPEEENAKGVIIPLEGNSYFREVIDNKKTVVIQDAQSDPKTKSSHDLYRERGTQAIMIVPLLVRGQAIGNIGLPALNPSHQFSDNEIQLAETIASQIASAVDNAQLYAQTETALGAAESDLEIGSQIQSGFFPNTMPNLPGWEIATHFHSARQVAGDFYDVFQFKGSNLTAFVIADVCDKGVGAALFMVLFRSLLRAFSDLEIDSNNVHQKIIEIIQKTNDFIAEIHGSSNMFATMFFGILDPENGSLHYINGGHEPPIILNKNGEKIMSLMPTGPAVGLFPHLLFEVKEINLDPGDILVGFTDGVTDALNKHNQFFTEERLLKSISAPWTSIFSMIFELEVELRKHIGGQDQFDDITLISFRRKLKVENDYHAICRPAKLEMLEELRDFVESAAGHSGLTDHDAFAFKLTAEEILTNIIQYGYQSQEPGLIALSFECDNQKVTMKIWDDGKYFPIDQAGPPDLGSDWEQRKLGGLGIYLVKELMDKVSYSREANETNLLVLEKYRTQ
ncbi:MAG: PAS domain S-box protein [Anaerolineales bacterium]|jgi:sigma-B regulation protein RsbU (phosphoserine phosphatase)